MTAKSSWWMESPPISPMASRCGCRTGVDIARSGNTYFIIDQAGNSVRATANSGYLDVSVGLGRYPVKVRGLLGNPDGDVKRLEASDGTEFSVPVSFNDLYNKYGDSWRVDPAKSLLSVCGTKTEQGNPGKPFFARDLDPALRERAQSICLPSEGQPGLARRLHAGRRGARGQGGGGLCRCQDPGPDEPLTPDHQPLPRRTG